MSCKSSSLTMPGQRCISRIPEQARLPVAFRAPVGRPCGKRPSPPPARSSELARLSTYEREQCAKNSRSVTRSILSLLKIPIKRVQTKTCFQSAERDGFIQSLFHLCVLLFNEELGEGVLGVEGEHLRMLYAELVLTSATVGHFLHEAVDVMATSFEVVGTGSLGGDDIVEFVGKGARHKT